MAGTWTRFGRAWAQRRAAAILPRLSPGDGRLQCVPRLTDGRTEVHARAGRSRRTSITGADHAAAADGAGDGRIAPKAHVPAAVDRRGERRARADQQFAPAVDRRGNALRIDRPGVDLAATVHRGRQMRLGSEAAVPR